MTRSRARPRRSGSTLDQKTKDAVWKAVVECVFWLAVIERYERDGGMWLH